VIILAIVSVLVLALMRALPGGPICMPVTGDQLTQMTPEQIDQLKQQLVQNQDFHYIQRRPGKPVRLCSRVGGTGPNEGCSVKSVVIYFSQTGKETM